jgi:hypothetical protein
MIRAFWIAAAWGATVDVTLNIGVWMYKTYMGGKLAT